MSKIKNIIIYIMSFPKTLYFNLKTFDLKTALRFPVIVKYNVKIIQTHKNCIMLKNFAGGQFYRIKYGFGGSQHICSNKNSIILLGKKGQIEFNGYAEFAEGISIRCEYGKISFGKNFSANKNCCFNCEYDMKIGDDVLLGWNINFRDTDGHDVYIDNKKSENQKKVVVGNHVWICSYVDLLKGAEIGNESVVAWKSCVIKPLNQDNCLIGGSPAKILKENIKWNK